LSVYKIGNTQYKESRCS